MSALSKTALKAAFEALPTPITRAALETLFDNTVDSYQDTISQLDTAAISALTPTLNQLVYNTDTNFLQQYNGANWVVLTPIFIGTTADIALVPKKAGQLFYNTTLNTISFGNGVNLKNLYDNIYTADGTLAADRNVDLDDKYLEFGDSVGDKGIAMGDLTNLGLPVIGMLASWDIVSLFGEDEFNVHCNGDGIFMGSHGTRENPETVISATQIGDVNVASISAYPADGLDQKGRCAASYNKATGEGYGMVCMASDFDNDSRNYFAAYNDRIKGRYYHSYTGELMAITIDDTGLQVDVDGTASLNIGYDGQISSDTLAALDFADDTAAAAGGVMLNGLYHNNGAVRIRLV